MNTHITRLAALSAALLLAGPALAKGGYAEALYGDFVAMHEGALAVEIKARASGPVDTLAGRDMASLTGLPKHTVVVDEESDFMLPKAAFHEANLEDIYLDDLATSVDVFAKIGYPLELGDYRMLDVVVQIGGQTLEHTAIEFCWNTLGHCVVFDPNIDFLDSQVNSWRTAKAEGWGLQIHEEPAIDLGDGLSQSKARCGLASNPSVTSRKYTRGARTVRYKSLAQLVVVTKNIGYVEAGLRCDSSCRPGPFAIANTSSGHAVAPNSIACGNRTNSGTSGGRGKSVAKSGCSHRFVLGAKFSATAKGVGLSADVQIDATGSVDSNGTSYIDTCGRY